jgi:hypothetical protein
MKHLGSLFAKYQDTFKPPQATVQKKAVLVIADLLQIQLREDQLSYKTTTRTLKINAPSVIRSEIIRRKPELLAVLQRELGVSNAPTDLL